MLVTFTSKVHADVVMFGDVATIFLSAMGQGTQPPGILRGEDIKLAADRLRAWLRSAPVEKSPGEEEDTENHSEQEVRERQNRIGLNKRALPLLELMDAAWKKNADFIWR